MAVSRRDQLVDTAPEMFCLDGFHAPGIDQILAKAGVAALTLSNPFRSNDELTLAVLPRPAALPRALHLSPSEGKHPDPRRVSTL